MAASKRMRRCSKHQGGSHSGDRISLLPDDIIIFILSFLNFKEAVVTSVLSRRWRHMWAFTKRLEFDFKDWRPADLDSRLRKSTNKFIEGVSQVLSSHKGSTLEQFRVSYGLNGKFKQEIDKWLKFASAKRVQRLELDFDSCKETVSRSVEDGIYELTYGVVDQNSGTSLKTLSSKFCTINGCKFACFESLKVLFLRGVNVSGEVLEDFLSCCPSLEKLTVHESMQLTRLKVQGPSLVLKYLEIRLCPMLEVAEICNVNLVTLVCTGRKTSWNLHNTPALVNLTIAGRNLNNPGLTQFSSCLSQLETLTMQSWNASEGLEREVVNVPLELSNLKKLVLKISMQADASMIGCTSLIKGSPKLQSFVLECSWCYPTIERREMRRVEKFQHQHIEEVEIRGYYGNKTHLELLMFFLENAVSLKKIIVDPNEVDGYWISKKDLERLVGARHRARRRAMRQLQGQMFQGVEVKIL